MSGEQAKCGVVRSMDGHDDDHLSEKTRWVLDKMHGVFFSAHAIKQTRAIHPFPPPPSRQFNAAPPFSGTVAHSSIGEIEGGNGALAGSRSVSWKHRKLH